MGWTVVTALSVLAIALLMLGFTVAALLLMRDLRRAMERLEQDGRPALQSVRAAADDASRVVAAVRGEVDGLVSVSQRLRGQATEAADRVAERIRDIEVVLDILQEEVEDTALDIAAALRATRRGAGVFRTLKRAILGRRR